jgi:hypothetical protein
VSDTEAHVVKRAVSEAYPPRYEAVPGDNGATGTGTTQLPPGAVTSPSTGAEFIIDQQGFYGTEIVVDVAGRYVGDPKNIKFPTIVDIDGKNAHPITSPMVAYEPMGAIFECPVIKVTYRARYAVNGSVNKIKMVPVKNKGLESTTAAGAIDGHY